MNESVSGLMFYGGGDEPKRCVCETCGCDRFTSPDEGGVYCAGCGVGPLVMVLDGRLSKGGEDA